MNRPAGRDCLVGYRCTVWPGCGPLGDQRSHTLKILRLWSKNRIDIPGGTNHPVTDQRDSTDEHIPDARAI